MIKKCDKFYFLLWVCFFLLWVCFSYCGFAFFIPTEAQTRNKSNPEGFIEKVCAYNSANEEIVTRVITFMIFLRERRICHFFHHLRTNKIIGGPQIATKKQIASNLTTNSAQHSYTVVAMNYK